MGEGKTPLPACLVPILEGVVNAAEPIVSTGLLVLGTELPGYIKGGTVIGAGLKRSASSQERLAQAVEGGALAIPVACLVAYGQ